MTQVTDIDVKIPFILRRPWFLVILCVLILNVLYALSLSILPFDEPFCIQYGGVEQATWYECSNPTLELIFNSLELIVSTVIKFPSLLLVWAIMTLAIGFQIWKVPVIQLSLERQRDLKLFKLLFKLPLIALIGYYLLFMGAWAFVLILSTFL